MYAKFDTLAKFNNWHLKINEAKGYAEGKPTVRHTEAKIKEGEEVVYANTYEADHSFWEGIEDLIPEDLITNEEFNALNWLPTENIL